MVTYSLTREELETFAKNVYDEGCHGYLDLKDSFCNKMVDDLLDDKKSDPVAGTTVLQYSETVATGSSGGYYNNYNTSTDGTNSLPISNVGQWTYYNVVTEGISASGAVVPSSVATGREELVRPEQFIRPESNFYGNESERL